MRKNLIITLRKSDKKNFISLFLSMICLQQIFCQSQILDELKQSINNDHTQYLQEKIFAHTDKSFYVAGEIIWFKLYDVEADSHSLLDISKVAYVEIINKDDKPVLQAKISLSLGLGSGSLYLPFTINSGNYKFRAYTSWMKNFSTEYFFEKNILIVNPTKKLGLKPKRDSLDYDTQFFPEGGNLVNGIESKVAFRVVGRSGKGIDFDGVIINQHNDTVAKIHPFKFGMGNFSFTPSADNKYTALIKTAEGKSIKSDLPDAYKDGYVMHLSDTTNNRLSITVSASNNLINLFTYLVIHSRQHVRFAEMKQLLNGKAVFTINKDSLKDGISYFTVFDYNKQPVCERLYFKKPSQAMIVNIKTDKEEYQTRRKINIDISSGEKSGNVTSANLSIAVYKMDSSSQANNENICTYLWLSSDLQGNVESPDYYLNNSDADAAIATDNLMLTNGWRRFRWENTSQAKEPLIEFPPEYEGHIILGKVVDKNSGDPVPDIQTFLSVPAKNFKLASAVSNLQGIIKFDVKDFYSIDGIAVQTANPQDSNYRIDILSPFSEKSSSRKIADINADMLNEKLLVSKGVDAQVQNIFAGENLQHFFAHETYDSTAFYGKPDQKYFLDDYTRFNTMEEVMREYIADITVRKHDGHFHYKVLDYPYRLFFEDDALVLFDGVPVTDINKIIAFDPLKVQKIEVMNRKYFLNSYVADGIISYSTYKGDLAGFQFDPNVLILKYDGLQLQREFYSPVYETQNQIDSRLPDFRNVLFWSPDIITDSSGKKQISFYSSDVKGKYVVVVQGITNDGKAGMHAITFNVGN